MHMNVCVTRVRNFLLILKSVVVLIFQQQVFRLSSHEKKMSHDTLKPSLIEKQLYIFWRMLL